VGIMLRTNSRAHRFDGTALGITGKRVATGYHRIADHQPIYCERLPIEIHALSQAERPVELAVKGRVKALDVDAQRVHQPLDCLAEQSFGRLQRLSPTVPEQQTITHSKFIALGVSTEIVVIFENQDARRATVRLAIKPRRRQAADTAADHHQIETLLDREAGDVERLALAADLVRDLERSGMAAAKTSQGRWVVSAGLGAHLSERSQTGSDGQCSAA